MSAPTVRVEEARAVDDALCGALERLLPQLSSSPEPVNRSALEDIVRAPSSILFVARDGEAVVGMLTLAVFRVPTGLRAWIEDVVVDGAARGGGIGAALVQAALDRAAALGVRTVDLTSRPSREAANRLYQRMGFQLRQTNVYRFTH